jgi:hypothetical protein
MIMAHTEICLADGGLAKGAVAEFDSRIAARRVCVQTK